MVNQTVVGVIQSYVSVLRAAGVNVREAVLFGSHAKGEANEDSDIDVMIIAPEFDHLEDRGLINLLWGLRTDSPWPLQPFPCGVRQWAEDDAIPIIEVARLEGVPIELPEAA